MRKYLRKTSQVETTINEIAQICLQNSNIFPKIYKATQKIPKLRTYFRKTRKYLPQWEHAGNNSQNFRNIDRKCARQYNSPKDTKNKNRKRSSSARRNSKTTPKKTSIILIAKPYGNSLRKPKQHKNKTEKGLDRITTLKP